MTGSQRRQTCHVPLGSSGTAKTRLPLANCGWGVGLVDLDDEVAPEGAVPIARSELARRLVPGRLEAPAEHDLLPAHVEDVREVRLDRDLEVQPDRHRGVARQVVVLVDAVADRAVEPEPDRAGRERWRVGPEDAAAERQLGAGELVARREVLDARRVEQDRRPAVDRQAIAGDEPGVTAEEADVVGRGHRRVRLGDQEPVVVVDRDRRGADDDGHADLRPDLLEPPANGAARPRSETAMIRCDRIAVDGSRRAAVP